MTPALDRRGRPRVAVTGIGVCVPTGRDPAALLAAVTQAGTRVRPLTGPDWDDHPVRYACTVDDLDAAAEMGVKEARRTDRVTHLGLAAAIDAWAHSQAAGQIDPSRIGIVVGTGIGGIGTLESQVAMAAERGVGRVSPMLVPQMMPNATAAHVSMHLGLTGPSLCVATACAAGTHAIGEATRMVRDGSADAVVVGGAEAAVTPVALAAFSRMGALSSNADGTRASRPFDTDRDGFVMGEGAAFLVLERLDEARGRGATVVGEVLGYGRTSDAHHVTAPAPGGAGAAACMRMALDDAGLVAAEIGHVNAHGTSTPFNDAAEAEAIGKVFGGSRVAVTSTKGVTGHLIGAAGAFEAVVALLAASDGLVPPTANHGSTDLDIDVVAGAPRAVGPAPAVSNSFGFGGHNATIVVGPPDRYDS